MMKYNKESRRDLKVFNTSLEVGFRVLIILNELKNSTLNLDRLIIYDYFTLHANDFNEENESIHPPIPNRSGEIVIKRKIIQESINLMHSKDLLDIEYSLDGILYKSNELTPAFLEYFNSKYAMKIIENAHLVIKEFNEYSDYELAKYVNENFSKWGSEFSRESLVRGWNNE